MLNKLFMVIILDESRANTIQFAAYYDKQMYYLCKQRLERGYCSYSHSIVAGGLLLISYTTRFIPFTRFIILLLTRANSS